MARYSTPVNVLVEDKLEKDVDSADLVPGDVIVVPKRQTTMPCDCILLTGTVIINEAMLTGESIPVIKTSLPIHQNDVYDADGHAKHTLFSGTNVI
jgi:P-type E1-E2 ATPase